MRPWRRELAFFAALAFSDFVFVKIADWLVAGFAVQRFGMVPGARLHAALFALALVAYVAVGLYRFRDRFSALVGAAMLAAPAAVWLWFHLR